MPLNQIPYTPEYFFPIRDFLVENYRPAAIQPVWQIDRWNFCLHVSQIIHETRESWPATVGLWLDEKGVIQALVHSEGENRGEAFIQLGPRPYTDQELGLFLDHAESALAQPGEQGGSFLELHIGPNFQQLIRLLTERGYSPVEDEKAGIYEIRTALKVELPPGLRLAVGKEFSDLGRGRAHSLAFGYADQGAGVLEKYHIVQAFQGMRLAPDYHPDLDLAVLDPAGEVAAFATFWFDANNRIGILEPLGTVPAYQRQGLARALLSEGITRLYNLGATRLYGGAGQVFYHRFGFKIVTYRQVWRKDWD